MVSIGGPKILFFFKLAILPIFFHNHEKIENKCLQERKILKTPKPELLSFGKKHCKKWKIL